MSKENAKALKKAIALRKEAFEKSKKSVDIGINSREDFAQFFTMLKRKLNLDTSLEEVLWVHLKSIGCDSKGKFEEGIKHFGYNI